MRPGFASQSSRRFGYWMWLAPVGAALALVPTAWLCSRLGCYEELTTCLVPAFLGLPLLAQILPSTRRRGGWGLGLITWILLASTLSLVQPYLPDPFLEQFALDGYRVSVAGVALDEERGEVERRAGQGRQTLDTGRVQVVEYPHELTVEYHAGKVVWLCGPSLEREERPVLYRGMPRRTMVAIFPRRRRTTAEALYEIRTRAGQFDNVTLYRPGWPDARLQVR